MNANEPQSTQREQKRKFLGLKTTDEEKYLRGHGVKKEEAEK